MDNQDTALTPYEKNKLEEIEGRIEKGARYMYCGLLEVYDHKLWKGGYDSFADYCEKRWSIGRANLYRTLRANRVIARIEGTLEDDMPIPNISQADKLASLPEEEQAEVWKDTVEETGGKPTAKVVTEKVRAMKPRQAPTVVDGPEKIADQALSTIGAATRQLVRAAEQSGKLVPRNITDLLTDLNKRILEWRDSL